MKQSSNMAIAKTGALVYSTIDRQIPGSFTNTHFHIGENTIQPCFMPGVLHSFYWPGMGTYGIPDSREISFTAADILRFEPAGYFENDPAKPLYYIKRECDKKYLSFTLGGPAYTGYCSSAYQKWMICNLGANKYCLMLPAVPGHFFIQPFTKKGKCFLSVLRSKDVSCVSSVTIYLKETEDSFDN